MPKFRVPVTFEVEADTLKEAEAQIGVIVVSNSQAKTIIGWLGVDPDDLHDWAEQDTSEEEEPE